MRSREISSIIIIQNLAQIKALFKDTWETIPGNCDTLIYLGGNEQSTHKYISELLGKGTIDKRSNGETRGKQGSSSRNYDVLGRELMTPDETRKFDNKKCLIFIRGFDPIVDNKFIPFKHPVFDQTADGKGKPYIHTPKEDSVIIGPPFEILNRQSLAYFEKLKSKGENVYIDELTYEEFMMLEEAGLGKRFTMLDEKEQKERFNREQLHELEYIDDGEKSSSSDGNGGDNLAGSRSRNKPDWEDTIVNRVIHWNYSDEQKAEMKQAIVDGIPKKKIMEYFYPEVSVEQMRSIRRQQ